MSDTESAPNPDQVHVLAGQLADGRFFGLMHKGEDGHPHTIIGRSLAELHRRLANAAISEFRMNQDDSTALATESVDQLHAGMTAASAGPPTSQLEDLQQEVMLVTAERDKALAEVDAAKAETVAVSAELDATKKTVSDLENRIAAMKDAPPASGDGSLTGEGSNPLPEATDPSRFNQSGAGQAATGGAAVDQELNRTDPMQAIEGKQMSEGA